MAADTSALTARRTVARTTGIAWGRVVRYILLLLSLVFVLIPVYVLFVTSFKNGAEASPATTWYLPDSWDPTNWINAWNELKGGLVRSLMLVVPSSLISAMLGSANGFVLSKWRFPGANLVFTLVLFGMFIPYQAVMIPLMRMVTRAGLGFGISTPAQAKRMADLSDGAIVGSAIVRLIAGHGKDAPERVCEYVRSMKAGMGVLGMQ